MFVDYGDLSLGRLGSGPNLFLQTIVPFLQRR
jgi:hypothetical protein